MKNIVLFASITFAAGLAFTNVYNSIVDAKSWGNNIPGSIETAREYFKAVNPGNFFRIFSPLNQIIGLIVLILYWKTTSTIRFYLGVAIAFYIFNDVITFAYFYPRNEILFKMPMANIEVIKKSWMEWSMMN